jgi:hypothetical protein
MTMKKSQINSQIRIAAGLSIYENAVPVELSKHADKIPTVHGERGGFFTRGGTQIDHPSAYSKVGWSNMVYRKDTRLIRVGEKWLKEHGVCPAIYCKGDASRGELVI